MAEAATAGATPLLPGLPDEIVTWEIFVLLPPKSLLRCRAVRRAWRQATSTRRLLLAHHARQPNLPVFTSDRCRDILAFDRRSAADDQLHSVARLDGDFYLEASCDGLLLLSKVDMETGSRAFVSVCNPATREHAVLGPFSSFFILGMYPHRPTGEYRLLLKRWRCIDSPKDLQVGCFVFPLGSDQPPRYIWWPELETTCLNIAPAVRIGDSLHWYPAYYTTNNSFPVTIESELVIVFDTIAESFQHIRAPIVPNPTSSFLFEMDDTLGIYSQDNATKIIDIWLLQNYETQVWDYKYRVELPVAEIRGKLEVSDGLWGVEFVSVDGGVLLLVRIDRWLLKVDSNGKLIAIFDHGRRSLIETGHRLKQSLVEHTFFPALQRYAVNALPFM